MVIKASAASEIRELIDALGGPDAVAKEVAIGRLGIIGARAVDRLLAAYRTADAREIRISVLRALEATGDPRTLTIARQGLHEGGDLACAAVAAIAPMLDGPHAPAATEALDALVEAALDTSLERRVRLAACQAVQHVPQVWERVAERLREEPDTVLAAGADALSRDRAAADAAWRDALEGHLPEDPAALRDVAWSQVPGAPVTALRTMIDRLRAQEASVAERGRREAWQAARGSLHQALALRGSRIAVYDLRETLDAADGPLPGSFLAALHVVGDASCVEPLAAAWARTPDAEARWKHQLGEAFRAITRREKITRRHAAFKRIASRWPDAARALSG